MKEAPWKKYLRNDCQSEKLGKVAMAVNSHQLHESTSMYIIRSVHDLWMDNAVAGGVEAKPQECLKATFNNPSSEKTKLAFYFFEKSDTVVLRHEYEATEDEGEYDVHCCSMTTINVFKYLNTLPNVFLFADVTKPMGNATKEGINFLNPDAWICEKVRQEVFEELAKHNDGISLQELVDLLSERLGSLVQISLKTAILITLDSSDKVVKQPDHRYILLSDK